MELVTGPLKLGRQDIADEYEVLLDHFPNLSILPLSRTILLDAACIRALRFQDTRCIDASHGVCRRRKPDGDERYAPQDVRRAAGALSR
jgi:hypothetical protein